MSAAFLLGLLGASSPPPRQAASAKTCGAIAPAGTRVADAAAFAALPGTYILVRVTTTPGWESQTIRVPLTLTQVARASGSARPPSTDGPGPGARLLRGWSSRGPGLRDTVIGEGLTFRVGCQDCTEVTPDQYRIRRVGPYGFWGSWSGRLVGPVTVRDRHGHRLGDPSGYFCALRVRP